MPEPQNPIIYRPAKAETQNSAYPPAINRTLVLLQSLKLPAWCQATPLHRFFWQRGILLSPPLLAGFISNLCGSGIFFALLTALALLLFSGWSPWAMGCGSVSAGIIGGLIVACRYREWRAEYNLPSWREIWHSAKE